MPGNLPVKKKMRKLCLVERTRTTPQRFSSRIMALDLIWLTLVDDLERSNVCILRMSLKEMGLAWLQSNGLSIDMEAGFGLALRKIKVPPFILGWVRMFRKSYDYFTHSR